MGRMGETWGGGLSEGSAVCQRRRWSVRGVSSLSETSGVCQRGQQSVIDVGSLSEGSAVCQRHRGSVRDVRSLYEWCVAVVQIPKWMCFMIVSDHSEHL